LNQTKAQAQASTTTIAADKSFFLFSFFILFGKIEQQSLCNKQITRLVN